MATSPNFNWPEPDNTDLVKNGALAIRTAVNAIDTSLVDLKGGTTGQVLAKATGTDMDFTWSTPANPTPKSFNYIINGGMDISQRGTSFVPTSGLYTLDRWYGQRYGSAGGTVTQVNTSDTTNLPQITKAMRIANNSGATAVNTLILNSLENSQTQQLLGQTVAISFYLRKGANYSGSDFTVALVGGTGVDQSLNSGFTGQTTLVTVTASPTTSWVRYQGTVTVGATYTQLGLVITSKGTGTAGANDWAEITGVQLELGSTATPFQRSGGTIQGELAACQRYYTRLANVGSATEYWFGSGYAGTTTQAQCILPLTSTMRSSTITLDYSGVRLQDYGAGYAISALIYVSSARNNIVVGATSSGLTANRPLAIDTNTTGYIGISAEL